MVDRPKRADKSSGTGARIDAEKAVRAKPSTQSRLGGCSSPKAERGMKEARMRPGNRQLPHSDEFATKEEEGKGGIQDEAEQRDDDDVDVRGELPWRDPFDHIREEYFVHSFDYDHVGLGGSDGNPSVWIEPSTRPAAAAAAAAASPALGAETPLSTSPLPASAHLLQIPSASGVNGIVTRRKQGSKLGSTQSNDRRRQKKKEVVGERTQCSEEGAKEDSKSATTIAATIDVEEHSPSSSLCHISPHLTNPDSSTLNGSDTLPFTAHPSRPDAEFLNPSLRDNLFRGALESDEENSDVANDIIRPFTELEAFDYVLDRSRENAKNRQSTLYSRQPDRIEGALGVARGREKGTVREEALDSASRKKRKGDGSEDRRKTGQIKHTKNYNKHLKGIPSGNNEGDKDDIDEQDDLAQDLNQDAFVRSTGGARARMRRARLLARFRKKREEVADGLVCEMESHNGSEAGTSTSCSDDDSMSSGPSSSASLSDPLIAEDFEAEDASKHPAQRLAKSASSSGGKRRGSPSHSQVATVTSTSTSEALIALGLGPRLTLRNQCDEWVRWMASQILDSFEGISRDRRKALTQSRWELKDKMKEDSNQILSQDMRRQFTWYLKRYPFFERRPVRAKDRRHTVGCAACHRKSQVCDSQFLFWGPLYHDESLERRDSSDSSSSDRSTGAEDERHQAHDEHDTQVFFLGSHCARRAAILHRYAHWEHRAMRELSKLPIVKESRKAIREAERRSNSGSYGRIASRAIEEAVTQYAGQLERRLKKLREMRDGFLFGGSRADHAYERWDD